MEDITEDESIEIAKEVYKIIKKNRATIVPIYLLKCLVSKECLRKYQVSKSWFVETVSDNLVEKME